MNKAILCVILPCLIALITANYVVPQYGGYPVQYGGYPAQYGAGTGQYAAYAAQSTQALRQARLFNYLLGGLYFLNLFNVTGNTIAG